METSQRPEDLFSNGMPDLSSERLTLRHPRREDSADLFEIFGDLESLRYWSHGPLADLPAMDAYLDEMMASAQTGPYRAWVVVERHGGRAIGTVSFGSWQLDHGRADIGFTLNQAFQGRGLAREAVETALTFGFGAMGLHRVEADVDPENVASIGLLERIGFNREGYLPERWFTYGEWRDTVLFGLLASNWSGRDGTEAQED